MRLLIRSLAGAALLFGATATARAEVPPSGTPSGTSAPPAAAPPLTPAPEPTDDAPPLFPPANLTRLSKPVPSPLHPRLRMMPAATLGGGVYCPDFSSPSLPFGRWCSAMIHLGMDGRFADAHVSFLSGDVLRYGALLGFELGTNYMQLGGKRSKAAIALRGSFDLLIAGFGERVPGHRDDGVLGFSNTYGPHLSVAMTPRSALEIRGAVGWTAAGFFNNSGFDRPAYRLVIESWVGVRVSP